LATIAGLSGHYTYLGGAGHEFCFAVNPCSSTALASSQNPSVYGQAVTFTATVTGNGGTPTGTVQFTVDGNGLGAPVSLDASGSATSLPTSSLSAGNHTVAALYSGDTDFQASTGALNGGQAVNQALSVSFDLASSSGSEKTAQPSIAVSLSAAATQTVAVDYAVDPGSTAVSGTNYALPCGTLTFAPGDITKNVPITILDDGVCSADLTVQITLSNPANAGLGATTAHIYTIVDANLVMTAETQDQDTNGWIEHIHMAANAPLSFPAGWQQAFDILVTGYTVAGYQTGSTASDFYVVLNENALSLQSDQNWKKGDTGNAPLVTVVSGTVARQDSAELLPTLPITAVDMAAPVLMRAWCTNSGGGMEANDQVFLQFSEPVTSNTTQVSFGLPVLEDTFGANPGQASGQNQNDARIVTITLGAGPQLTPGGAYSPAETAAGSPSGVWVSDGTDIVDSARNTAVAGPAVDLEPDTENVSICWLLADGTFSIAARDWRLAAASLGSTYRANDAFAPDVLTARNNGNVSEKLFASCSGASRNGLAPYVWALVSSAGPDQFEMKVETGAGMVDLAGWTGNGADISPVPLYSGQNLPFDLQLRLPLSVTGGAGAAQTISVTITAVKN